MYYNATPEKKPKAPNDAINVREVVERKTKSRVPSGFCFSLTSACAKDLHPANQRQPAAGGKKKG
jgi:hypothetical protein